MNKRKLKIYLAEDHHVVRKGMQRLLNSFQQVDVVKDVSNGRELLELIEEDSPDAVILDVEMPVMGGIEAARVIADRYPWIKMMVLTMHAKGAIVDRLSDIGVHAFLNKTAAPEEVEKTLYSILNIDPDTCSDEEKSITAQPQTAVETFDRLLTEREIEILTLICNELTPGEISSRLGISEKTYFNHRANIISKTKVRNNVGLIRYALQAGVCEI